MRSGLSPKFYLAVSILALQCAGVLAFTISASAQQFVVTNGTTQTAVGPSYSAVVIASPTPAIGSALFASGANSTINGTNLTLNSAAANAGGAFAGAGGLINLTGASVTTTAAGSFGLSSAGRIVASGLTITTSGSGASGAGVSGNVATPATMRLTNSTIVTSGTGDIRSGGALAQSGLASAPASVARLELDTVSVRTTGNGTSGLRAANGIIVANNVTVTTSGGLNGTLPAHGVSATPGSAPSLSGGQVTITGNSSVLTTGIGMNALNADGFFGATAFGRSAISMTGGASRPASLPATPPSPRVGHPSRSTG